MNIQTAKSMVRAAAKADDTVLFEGPHGIGKSDACKQIAQEDDYHMETLFLSAQEVGDLIGSPHTIMLDGTAGTAGTAVTTWSVPIWLNRMNQAAKAGKKCICFLDELNRAPLDVRQSAMQLVLERQIHEHTLPTVDGQRTLVVAAINPADDYQVDELDPALMDRFLHCSLEADAPSWLQWARKNGVNQVVRDFITEHPDRIHWTPADGGIGATPRSWSKLGQYLDNVDSIEPEALFQIMKGKIGTEVASQFYSFFKNYVGVVKLKDIEDIVTENKSKFTDIEKLAELIVDVIGNQEAIQKTELAHQLKDKYDKRSNMLPLLVYLYALEIEICVAFLKGFRADDQSGYTELVGLDSELNNKKLFTRIVQAANKT